MGVERDGGARPVLVAGALDGGLEGRDTMSEAPNGGDNVQSIEFH